MNQSSTNYEKHNTYITEKLKIRKTKYNIKYNYFPKSKEELQDIINQLIEERGNKGDFNDIDVSNITDMSDLFDFASIAKFNGDISMWDVSNVTDMKYMFFGCKVFNQDISNWDVSKVKKYDNIFFNCPIEEKYKPKKLKKYEKYI